MTGLIDYFVKGGSMMWPLLAVAIIGLVFILERLFALFISARANPEKLVKEIIEIIEEKGVKEALEHLYQNKSPVAKVLAAGLEKTQKGRAVVEEAMVRKALSELAFLDRGMIYLAACATLGPILGFLGTVTGMIRAFQAIALAGEVEPTLVASGISEALITTATGLMIAAPVSLFYSIFATRTNSYQRKIEEASNALIEYLTEKGVVKEYV